jgi:hypothetical protein
VEEVTEVASSEVASSKEASSEVVSLAAAVASEVAKAVASTTDTEVTIDVDATAQRCEVTHSSWIDRLVMRIAIRRRS